MSEREAGSTDALRAALERLDERWSLMGSTRPHNDLTLPAPIRDFIASIRSAALAAPDAGEAWKQPLKNEPGGWKNPTYFTECETCGTRLRVTSNYSPMGDFLDQSAEPVASYAGPAGIDVERLGEAGANVLDGRRIGSVRLYRNTITPDDWEYIAAEYDRLSRESDR
jgi:hypothetical protein